MSVSFGPGGGDSPDIAPHNRKRRVGVIAIAIVSTFALVAGIGLATSSLIHHQFCPFWKPAFLDTHNRKRRVGVIAIAIVSTFALVAGIGLATSSLIHHQFCPFWKPAFLDTGGRRFLVSILKILSS